MLADVLLHAGDAEASVTGLADFADGLPEPDAELVVDLARTAQFAAAHLSQKVLERLQSHAQLPTPHRPRRPSGAADPDRAVAQQEQLVRAVAAGRAHVGTLASATQQTMAETFARFKKLPMVASDGISRDEIASARAALGGGAVVGTGALNTLSLFDEDLATKLMTRLPREVVAQAVLDDISQAHLHLLYRNTPGGDPILLRRIETMALIAARMRVEPDVDVVTPSSSDAVFARQNLDSPSRAGVSSLGLAERTGFALWCDDRVLRVSASESGSATFSTAALLVALDERGALDGAERERATKVLRVFSVAVFGARD